MSKPQITLTHPAFFKKLIKYHGFTIINDNDYDQQFYIEHFDEHNYLIDLNRFFSSRPVGDLMDRTGSLTLPFNYRPTKPWIVPNPNFDLSLEDILAKRVQQIIDASADQTINLFWSGGIDSTTMLTAFFMYCDNLRKIRIVYSPMSIKENPHFFLLMTTLKDVTLYDYSGENYLRDLDGISVTGDVADEITASLDDSFYKNIGFDGLMSNWEDAFKNKDLNPDLIEFCKTWFAKSGLEIKTVLQARWWFYLASKYHLFDSRANIASKSFSFFEMTELEHYIALNLNKLISESGYHTYKQFFKDFIFKFDKNPVYNKTKTKTNSFQIIGYRWKRLYLQDSRYIAILSDDSRVATPNLPLLSEKEYRNTYNNTLEYLFNKKKLAVARFR